MGYTALLRWATTPAASASPLESVLQCVLDQYNIIPEQSTPGVKQTVSLRTYRAALPDPRLLTVITFPTTEGLEKTAFLMTDRKTGTGGSTPSTRFQTLAVSPPSSVVPLLNAMSSPFVIGVAKAAKASAATTNEKPTASALTGQHLILQTIQLSTPLPPQLAISLRIHILTSPHTGLILEAQVPDGIAPEVCHEFLRSCIPIQGGKLLVCGEQEGWQGAERVRRVAELLGQCLREEGII